MKLRAEKVAYTGIFTAAALMLTYLESLLPSLFLPGCKLGLSNILLILLVYQRGDKEGFFLLICKTALSALLFGSPQGLLFSLFGGFLAFGSVLFSKHILGDKVSFWGVSLLSAACHHLGQMTAAYLVYGKAVLSYLPVLLLTSVLTGSVTGCLLLLLFERNLLGKRRKNE